MSYDVELIIDTGAESLTTVVDVGNMTSNVADMWYLAMPYRPGMPGRYNGVGDPSNPEEARGGLTGLSGLLAGHAIAILQEGVDYMIAHRAELEAIEPENRWGSYASALAFLQKVLKACQEHPKCTLGVNW